MILSASCGIEGARVVPYKPLLDEAIKLAKHKPPACMILQRPQCEAQLTPGRDHDWRTVWENAVNYAKTSECVPVAATDPLYILYTSGTTGIPKGVVRDNGGHMVALKWSMQNLYGVSPGEVWWSGSDIGWVVGHSYIVYAPLFHGCTSILYEGKPVGTPDAGAFWRLIAQHGVVSLFTAPTAFRAIRKEDPKGEFIRKYDLSKFRTLFLAGERADPPTIQWAEEMLQRAGDRPLVADRDRLVHRRQSGRASARCRCATARPACRCRATPSTSSTRPTRCSRPTRSARSWSSCRCRRPASRRLWQQDERFRESYLAEFPGYYKTADAGYKDDDGYVYVMSRTDDIINVAGHRLSTGGMEEVLAVAPGRRRMRRARHQGRSQGRGALRLHRAQGRRQPPAGGDREGDRRAGAREDRPGGGVQAGDHGGAAAEDALGQDPARHHQEDGRRRALDDAGDDRRSGDSR